MKNTDKKDKIKLSRIIKNAFYVVGYAYREDKQSIIIYFLSYCFFQVGNALFDTLVLKITIDKLSDNSPLVEIIGVILAGLVIICMVAALDNVVKNITEAKLVKTTGIIQRRFIDKASRMDLICYDNPDYFSDFVIAADQCDVMMRSGITCITYISGNVLGIITASSIIMTINPIIAIFPVTGFVVNIITRFAITKQEYSYEMEKKRIDRKANYSKRVFYQPEYAKEIKLNDIEVPLKNQFLEAIDEEREMAKKYGIKIAILSLVNWIMVFTFLSYFCVPSYLAYLALVKMKITLGDVASLNNAANIIRGRLDSTNYALVEFQKVGQFAERFRKFIDYEERIETFKGEEKLPTDSTLEIKNLSYKYEGADNYTLKNVNMTIKPGEHIAIVGENGAGKTTFIKLLMKLYEYSEGEITYGKIPISKLTTADYRGEIGAVFQDFQIYAATLAENVVMDKTTEGDKERIIEALDKADFSKKLAKLDNNINVEMTREFDDSGTMLSGGESQKVAISRLFMSAQNQRIAILDEPSSALDPIAEYTLNNNMMEYSKGSTIIFISHRLSTTRDADRIYMFEHGEIIEQGTHEELMEINGEYAKMFERQAHYYQETV